MSITTPKGFVAAGHASGIKASGVLDLALVATDDGAPVPAAATFTTNLAAAAPVQVSRDHLRATGGRATAVLVSSGNANAATGAQGRSDAERMCALTASALGVDATEVLVCSTGLIGIPLPMKPIEPGIAALVAGRAASSQAAEDAATAILTTDGGRKEVLVEGAGFTMAGMAKGAGMLAPDMATMLAFLTTDADVAADDMTRILRDAADRTFNTLNVDGATSTNDTAILLASGRRGKPDPSEFADAVHKACEDLTLQMARDAEARIAAKSIAENNLVKCSWYGGDPYWGRLLAAAGSAGIAFETEKTAVAYGGTIVARGGTNVEHDHEAIVRHMAGERIEIEVALGLGEGRAQVIGIDLGPGYIKENSRTS
jgi:glutamate N-acetyltransferase/amino-acid N-acetyltransferase